jgi:aspartyl protease family protein
MKFTIPFPYPSRRLSAILGALLLASAPVRADSLRARLEALAAEARFTVEGAERLGPEEVPPATGSPAERIRSLLRDYNHLVVGPAGAIEKVLITSRKDGSAQGSASSAYVKTTRLGPHHQVEAWIAGPNAVSRPVNLLVDTGATTVVLPESMMKPLGFDPDALREGTSQTARGRVPIKTGILPAVRVGAVSAAGVEVSFIADRHLNGSMLLGMSFLKRFRMTIDDDRGELILFAR